MLLAVYYTVRAIFSNAFAECFDYDANIVALIIFAVVALILAFCLFMLYKRTKHIDLGEQ